MKTNFENVTTFNMDEYIGLPPEHQQSYHYFMNQHLFNKTKFHQNNIPDGMAFDIINECKEYEQKIKNSGGIDLFLCGLGTDGHLAFNEPGSSFNSVTRIKTLTPQTIKDNSNFIHLEKTQLETVIQIQGKVVHRSKETFNGELETGEIEVVIEKFSILVRVDAIDLIRKSSKSEPSSRFFGRLKIFDFRDVHYLLHTFCLLYTSDAADE